MQRNVKAVVLALGLALASATAGAKTVLPGSLLEVDQNRGAIVESIVEKWGPVLEKSGAGIDKAALREMVRGLRADRLMAASLAGSPEGLRDVIALSLTSSAPVSSAAILSGQVKASADQPDALGNASADLVYTPVTPCRLFDTRASQGGMGTPGLNVRRTYGAIVPVVNQGGPGGCAAPSGATVALMVIGTLTPSGAGLLQGGPQGVANFPNALILYQSGDQYGATIAMPLNPANGQFDLLEQSATADLYGDLLGYFRAPQGGYVSSISAGNGICITGSATAPTIGISSTYSNLNIYRWSGGVGTINQGAAFAFYGPTVAVPVAANQSITGTVSAALSTSPGSPLPILLCATGPVRIRRRRLPGAAVITSSKSVRRESPIRRSDPRLRWRRAPMMLASARATPPRRRSTRTTIRSVGLLCTTDRWS